MALTRLEVWDHPSFRLRDRPDLVNVNDANMLDHSLFNFGEHRAARHVEVGDFDLSGWVWCSTCQRAWSLPDLMLWWSPPWEEYVLSCGDAECGAMGIKAALLPYGEIRKGEWPATPVSGQRLAVNSATL